MDEYLDEEMQIMKERTQDNSKTLETRTFTQPIQQLCKYLRPLKKLEVSATIGEAVKLMQQENIGAVVITRDGKLAGIVTERDLMMKVIGKKPNYQQDPITDIMTADPSWLQTTDRIGHLMNEMHMGGYRHVPIVNNDNEPLYLISIRDVQTFILEHFPEEILNLPPRPEQNAEEREGA